MSNTLILILGSIGFIWGLGIMLLIGLLFLAAIKNNTGLNFGHVLASIVWPFWIIYYLRQRKVE